MESTILPLELVFEHRNYLPSFGLIVAATDLLAGATLFMANHRRYLAGAVIVLLAALTWLRAEAWSSETGILATALVANPESQRARADLANVLTVAGRPVDARRLLEASASLAASLQQGYLDCQQTGRVSTDRLRHACDAVGRFLSDTETGLLIELVNLDLSQRCAMDSKVLLSLVEAAGQVPRMSQIGRQKLWMYVGHLRHQQHDAQGARAALEHAYAIDPENPVPLALAANWAFDTGDGSAACGLYLRAWAAAKSGAVDIEAELGEIERRLLETRQACQSAPAPVGQAR